MYVLCWGGSETGTGRGGEGVECDTACRDEATDGRRSSTKPCGGIGLEVCCGGGVGWPPYGYCGPGADWCIGGPPAMAIWLCGW
jgi:hypothetical protein